MKRKLKKVFAVASIFAILLGLLFACGKKEKTRNAFETKQEGVYGNYISAAKNYYEKLHGKNMCRYENVICEYVYTRDAMAQSNHDQPILKYVVLLVYEEENKKVARNYLCEVTKGEFEKIVKANTEKITSYIADAVSASDKITSNRDKTDSINFEGAVKGIKAEAGVGGGAAKIGGEIGEVAIKTDIGKIYDAVGDTFLGTAAGIEEVFNQIKNGQIRENQIVEKMTDEAYFYAVNYYSRYIYEDKGINVSPLKTDELLEYYLDGNERSIYEKLINDNGWSYPSVDEVEAGLSNYEQYLKENGIVKTEKGGYASHHNKNLYFVNFKVEIPDYFKRYKNTKDEQGFTTGFNNENDAILVVINDSVDVGQVKKSGVEEIQHLVNGIAEKLNCKEKFVLDNKYKMNPENDFGVNGYLYSLMSDSFYAETFAFNDFDQRLNLYIILIEHLKGTVEYNADFKLIYDNIKRIREGIKIDSRRKIISDKILVGTVKEYFKDKGFTNIELKPNYNATEEILANIGSVVRGVFGAENVPRKRDYVYDIRINGRDFDDSGVYRENDKVEIFYHESRDKKSDSNNGIDDANIIGDAQPPNLFTEQKNNVLDETLPNNVLDETLPENQEELFLKKYDKLLNKTYNIIAFVSREGGLIPTKFAQNKGLKFKDRLKLADNIYLSNNIDQYYYAVPPYGLYALCAPLDGGVELEILRESDSTEHKINISSKDFYEYENVVVNYIDMGIEFELLRDRGFVVKEVAEGSISKMLNIEKGDILYSLDGNSFVSEDGDSIEISPEDLPETMEFLRHYLQFYDSVFKRPANNKLIKINYLDIYEKWIDNVYVSNEINKTLNEGTPKELVDSNIVEKSFIDDSDATNGNSTDIGGTSETGINAGVDNNVVGETSNIFETTIENIEPIVENSEAIMETSELNANNVINLNESTAIMSDMAETTAQVIVTN